MQGHNCLIIQEKLSLWLSALSIAVITNNDHRNHDNDDKDNSKSQIGQNN